MFLVFLDLKSIQKSLVNIVNAFILSHETRKEAIISTSINQCRLLF